MKYLSKVEKACVIRSQTAQVRPVVELRTDIDKAEAVLANANRVRQETEDALDSIKQGVADAKRRLAAAKRRMRWAQGYWRVFWVWFVGYGAIILGTSFAVRYWVAGEDVEAMGLVAWLHYLASMVVVWIGGRFIHHGNGGNPGGKARKSATSGGKDPDDPSSAAWGAHFAMFAGLSLAALVYWLCVDPGRVGECAVAAMKFALGVVVFVGLVCTAILRGCDGD